VVVVVVEEDTQKVVVVVEEDDGGEEQDEFASEDFGSEKVEREEEEDEEEEEEEAEGETEEREEAGADEEEAATDVAVAGTNAVRGGRVVDGGCTDADRAIGGSNADLALPASSPSSFSSSSRASSPLLPCARRRPPSPSPSPFSPSPSLSFVAAADDDDDGGGVPNASALWSDPDGPDPEANHPPQLNPTLQDEEFLPPLAPAPTTLCVAFVFALLFASALLRSHSPL
jgi:hypothetical protein